MDGIDVKKVEEGIKKVGEQLKDKIKVGTGVIFSYIETITIFVACYILPIILLFVDKIYKVTIGQNLCQFYETNLDGIVLIFTVLNAIFVGKTFTKAKEISVEELKQRSDVGKVLVSTIGGGVFLTYLLVAPILTFMIPYIKTYLNAITWSSVGFIFTIGAMYIGNKIVSAGANKAEIIASIKEGIKESN